MRHVPHGLDGDRLENMDPVIGGHAEPSVKGGEQL